MRNKKVSKGVSYPPRLNQMDKDSIEHLCGHLRGLLNHIDHNVQHVL